MTRIAIAVGSRATFSSVQSVITELGSDATVLAYGSALSERYGAESIAWPPQTVRFTTLLDGDHSAATQTAALTMSQVGGWLAQNRPDAVLVNGDRYEQLGVAYAAALQNIPVCHSMAGEVSGSIDDRVRGAISALSDVRFAATALAAKNCDGIHTGCPRIDRTRRTLEDDSVRGLGPCVLVYFHPVTTEGNCGEQMRAVLDAAIRCSPERPVELVWPNSDPGNLDIVHAIREVEDRVNTRRSLTPEQWTKALAECSVLVGNSSSGIREGAFIGVPYVCVGTRQRGRECAGNVTHCAPVKTEIMTAIVKQTDHGPYERSLLYGDGKSGRRIANILLGENRCHR